MLAVASNELTGPLPDLSQLPRLREAYFDFNQLSGPVPAGWTLPARLRTLWVNGNKLHGPLPETIAGGRLRVFLADPTVWLPQGAVSWYAGVPNPPQSPLESDPMAKALTTTGSPLDTTPPALEQATVNRAALALTYDEALDEGSAPAAAAYTVVVNGAAVALSGVAVRGRATTLTLSAAVTPGQRVTVTYTRPAYRPWLQDVARNAAGDLVDQVVRNQTPAPPGGSGGGSGSGGGGGGGASAEDLIGYLENPGAASFQSGIGVISGWVCDAADVVIEMETAGGVITRHVAAYGTERRDTRAVCGDADNGFGLLFNWNLLGAGVHEVAAWVDGVELGRATVRVTTLGEEFVRDAAGTCTVTDFPSPGETVTLEWQQNQQNFVITEGE